MLAGGRGDGIDDPGAVDFIINVRMMQQYHISWQALFGEVEISLNNWLKLREVLMTDLERLKNPQTAPANIPLGGGKHIRRTQI